MIFIYSNKQSTRLSYIVDFIFGKIAQLSYRITNNLSEFSEFQGVKLNYSKHLIGNIPFLYSHDILFEDDIKNQDNELKYISTYQDVKIMFLSSDDSIIPFDIFAASFYLLTRYEEYLPFSPDKYGRFPSNISIAAKNNFLNIPIIDRWVNILITKLLPESYKFPVQRKFKFQPTFDIDNYYAYLNKGFFRAFASTINSIIKCNFSDLVSRSKVYLGLLDDPYNTFKDIEHIITKYNLNPLFFVLFAAYSPFDKNNPISNKIFRRNIKQLADKYTIGIHPGFASNKDFNILKTEYSNLNNLINDKITFSRQHFLRLKFPETYQNLLKLGIKKDYTMGYPDATGFRAGTCTPFYWFDLSNNKVTSLEVYPLAVMDTTLNSYIGCTVSEALEKCKIICNEVVKVNGTLLTLWHNESFSDLGVWKGWKNLFEDFVKYIQQI